MSFHAATRKILKKKRKKTNKTCYNCDKTNHFMKDCCSKSIIKKQINILSKEEFKKKMYKKNHDKKFDFFNIDLNENKYYLIKNQKICNKF